ncbi:hypothetical protein FAZ95_26975 [Trinickia violacea]|uniref:Uncharacterized protein n=1 Tax=Trinickia violacea TaxID=2571746 RepID=A0A4P8IWB1_9BURK|nr:hypothetical protein FAZ95_26975 [Trinickia violacea]
MLPFLSLHALVAQRGDGLRPELLAMFQRYARSEAGLSAAIEPDEAEVHCKAPDVVRSAPANSNFRDEPLTNGSCRSASGQ